MPDIFGHSIPVFPKPAPPGPPKNPVPESPETGSTLVTPDFTTRTLPSQHRDRTPSLAPGRIARKPVESARILPFLRPGSDAPRLSAGRDAADPAPEGYGAIDDPLPFDPDTERAAWKILHHAGFNMAADRFRRDFLRRVRQRMSHRASAAVLETLEARIDHASRGGLVSISTVLLDRELAAIRGFVAPGDRVRMKIVARESGRRFFLTSSRLGLAARKAGIEIHDMIPLNDSTWMTRFAPSLRAAADHIMPFPEEPALKADRTGHLLILSPLERKLRYWQILRAFESRPERAAHLRSAGLAIIVAHCEDDIARVLAAGVTPRPETGARA